MESGGPSDKIMCNYRLSRKTRAALRSYADEYTGGNMTQALDEIINSASTSKTIEQILVELNSFRTAIESSYPEVFNK